MPREVVLLLLSFSCGAAIWPPQLDAYKRVSTGPIDITEADAPVWKEYGLQESERAEYTRPGRTTKIVVEAWRLIDATSATAAFQWVKGTAKPGATVYTHGNHVVSFVSGYKPTAGELEFWTDRLPNHKYGPGPTLPTFLPKQGRLAGRDRYILGPASLRAFLPAIAPEAANFAAFQTEAQVAEYPEGTLAVFRFPTPAIAKGQLAEFQKLNEAKIKRSGPVIFVLIGRNGPVSDQVAEKLLKGVSFDVLFDYTETTPTKMPNVAGMILAIFELAGVVILVGLGGGLLVAGWLVFARRSRGDRDDPSMTTLKLDN
jgi:hypothetical protein